MSNYVFICHPGFSGSTINLFDYANLLYSFGFNIVTQQGEKEKISSYLDMSLRQYNFKFNEIPGKILNCDTLVTDTLSLLWSKKHKIIAKQAYILDNLELALLVRKIQNPYISQLQNSNLEYLLRKDLISQEYNLLVTPFLMEEIKQQITKLNIIPYLKKIDVPVLSTIKYNEIKNKFSRACTAKDVDCIDNIYDINVFDYKTYVYRRRSNLSFIEMFGRLIFEFKLLSKKVVFHENLFNNRDGLQDYVSYYGLSKSKMLSKGINIWDYNLTTLFEENKIG